MIKRDTLIKKQHELSHHLQFFHKELRFYEKEKLNNLNMMKAAWKSHDLKGIEKFAHLLAFDKEMLAKRQKQVFDCKKQIKQNKIELKNLPNELASFYDDQEELNKQKNILKMAALPKVFKEIEKDKLELKDAFTSKKLHKVAEISANLCENLEVQKEFLKKLNSIRKKMKENHSHIERLKRKPN
jgi:hypothetical protein